MVTVNIHEAKTQLSKLVDQAVKGEAFVIAKTGKPLVKVAAPKEVTMEVTGVPRVRAAGSRGDPPARSSHPSQRDLEVAGACRPACLDDLTQSGGFPRL
jgi:antitoxin (DNA-binding transcriptional repressor) of toxin-antitoxin stability system